MLRQSNKNFTFKNPYYSFEPKKGYKVIVLDDIITNQISTCLIYNTVKLRHLFEYFLFLYYPQ